MTDTFFIIEDLLKTSIPSNEILTLKELDERDGFQFVKKDDYKAMNSFISMYQDDYGKIIPILTDNNSNYLCVVVEGGSLGTIVSLSHNEEGLVRIFDSIPTMVKKINENKIYWDIFEFPDSLRS